MAAIKDNVKLESECEQRKQKKVKIIEYDILRVIATTFVVIGHSTFYTMQDTLGYINFQITDYLSFRSGVIYSFFSEIGGWIYTFHMPLFFFLSGAVFAIKSLDSMSLDSIIKNKFIRLIIPYFLVLCLFSIPLKTISGFYQISDLVNVYSSGLTFQETTGGHLWFLIALFWCLISFYPIAKILSDRYFTILLVCFLLTNGSYMVPSINIMLWNNPFTYIFWFSLGYVFHQYRQDINEFLDNKGIFFVLIMGILSLTSAKFNYLNSFLQTLVSIIFIYGICHYLARSKRIYQNKCYQLISKNTFGIYLFHDPLNYVLLYLVYETGVYRWFSIWFIVLGWFVLRILGNMLMCCGLNTLINLLFKRIDEIYMNMNSSIKYIFFWIIIMLTAFLMFLYPIIG